MAKMKVRKLPELSKVMKEEIFRQFPVFDPVKDREEKQRKRKEDENRAKADFIQRAMSAGFTRKQAVFLCDNFASLSHEHWDGRIGP